MTRNCKDGLQPAVDGRVLRSERSRQSIVDALVELVGEGVLTPTGAQIAERADVGIRTVFRHFDDMDTLFVEVTARLEAESLPALESVPSGGTVAERVSEVVRIRCQVFERTSPYWRSTAVNQFRSAYLSEEYASIAPRLRSNLRTWLPELSDAPVDVTDALELITSPEAWHRLRQEQKLGVKRATQAMYRAASAVCADLKD
jgi:AcrR family transcriptional regulator